MIPYLRRTLLEWHDQHGRHELPWNLTIDPYKIWLSEVILQQTQVSQGLPYFLKFIKQYPDVRALANASIDEVLKLWEGLGYYSRARNLHKGAVYVVEELGGKFPSTRKGLIKIPGVGPYTSAAIASFAYGHAHPVVDGNVIRILSRVFGITASVQEPSTLRSIEEHAEALMKGAPPADLNRAMMDLGATVCRSRNPRCEQCPWRERCQAYQGDLQAIIPFKHKKVKKKRRVFHLLVDLDERGQLLSTKREDKDIWKGLYSLPEAQEPPPLPLVAEVDHQLTHRDLNLFFYTPRETESLKMPISEALNRYAYPVAIRRGLESIL